MAWYDNVDARGYRNYNYYDSAQPFNENLTNENYGKSFTGIGRWDPRTMMRPSNLTQDLGAATYEAPAAAQLNTLDPNWQHQLRMQNINRGNIDNTWSSNVKDNIGKVKSTIGNWATGIMDNTIAGKIAAGFDATNPRAFNYNPALRGQIDYMKANNAYGVIDSSGLNKITRGVLAGQNLQSGFGTNDLGQMLANQLSKYEKTYANLDKQWGNTLTDEELEAKKTMYYNKFIKPAKIEKQLQIDAAKKAADERIAIEKQLARTAPQRREGKGGTHMSRSRDQGGLGISQSQAQSISDANRAAGMSGWGLAQGGRAGYNRGRVVNPGGYQGDEFEDENTLEFMNDQGIPHGEMAEASPFEMRIQELMDEGMSWQEAYQIASEEFGQIVEGEGDSFSEDGIASIV